MDDTSIKILVPIGTALLGFVLSYVLHRLKERKEPRHRISWHATTEQGVIHAIPDLRADIELSYKGSPVQDLTVVSCTVENTGNRVVKNHRVRFEFPPDCAILDAKLDPKPPRELSVERKSDQEAGEHEAVYEIGHLERGQRVSTRLLASGKQASSWQIYSFNDSGDVEFQPRDAARSTDDSEHILPFFSYTFMMFIAAVIFLPVAGPSSTAAFGLSFLEVAFAGFLLPHISPVARLLRDYLLARIRVSVKDPSVVVYGGAIESIHVSNDAHHGYSDNQVRPSTLPSDMAR